MPESVSEAFNSASDKLDQLLSTHNHHVSYPGHWSGLFKLASFQSSSGWNIPLKRIKQIAMLVSSFKVLGKKRHLLLKDSMTGNMHLVHVY